VNIVQPVKDEHALLAHEHLRYVHTVVASMTAHIARRKRRETARPVLSDMVVL
jgi:hypothetical protein